MANKNVAATKEYNFENSFFLLPVVGCWIDLENMKDGFTQLLDFSLTVYYLLCCHVEFLSPQKGRG